METRSDEPLDASLAPLVRSVRAALGFARDGSASVDTQRPGGVLRVPTQPIDADDAVALSFHDCTVHDLAAEGAMVPSLDDAGFDTVDLSLDAPLQPELERIRRARELTADDARLLRRLLTFRSFPLGSGGRLRLLFVADEGIILRASGPNGIEVHENRGRTAISGHAAASAVHGDQDVRGTPVRQILRGAGPWLFRHRAPDGQNLRSPIFLMNLWIPLQQITRPLALMDGRSVDRRRQQARYALPTESFLERDESRRLNDIWSIVHDPSQHWYFTSEMDARRGYVFNTLDTPHGAFVVPGEPRAATLYHRLERVVDAIGRRDAAAIVDAATLEPAELPGDTTRPLRLAIAAMEARLEEARREASSLVGERAAPFVSACAQAMHRVVRRSIELRTVAWVTPARAGRTAGRLASSTTASLPDGVSSST